jgi:hypothetical protein
VPARPAQDTKTPEGTDHERWRPWERRTLM